MLPKTQRMTRQEFAAVFVRGRRTHTPLFQVIVDKKTEKTPKYAAVVSKKVAKTAVTRNTLRRALYRALDAATKATPNTQKSLIVIAKKPALTASATELKEELLRVVGHRGKSR